MSFHSDMGKQKDSGQVHRNDEGFTQPFAESSGDNKAAFAVEAMLVLAQKQGHRPLSCREVLILHPKHL